MSGSTPRTPTYEALLQLPDTVVGEIVAGQLVTSPRPAPGHAFATIGLSIAVGSHFHMRTNGPGGWIILPEPELHLV